MSRIFERARSLLDDRRVVWISLLLFVGLRAAAMFLVPVEPTSDALWYYGRAAGLAAGLGYSEDGVPTAYWPVGWPGAMATWFWIFGTSVVNAKLLNLAAAIATFFLVHRLALLMTGSLRVARLSALVLAVYPNNLAYTGLLLSEVWITFLVLAAAWLYFELRTISGAAASGILAGLAMLSKSQMILLVPFIVALDALADRRSGGWRRSGARGAVLVLVMAAVVTPWTLRNYAVLRAFVPVSTNGGLTLLTGNNPSARGSYTDDDALVRSVFAKRTVANQVQIDREARGLAMSWIEENPAQFAKLLPLKIWSLWAVDGEAAWEFEHGYPGYEDHRASFIGARLLNQALYAALLIGFAFGTVRLIWFRSAAGTLRPASTLWLGAAFALIITGIAAVFSGQPRFHFPVMPFLVIVACWAMVPVRAEEAAAATRARATASIRA